MERFCNVNMFFIAPAMQQDIAAWLTLTCNERKFFLVMTLFVFRVPLQPQSMDKSNCPPREKSSRNYFTLIDAPRVGEGGRAQLVCVRGGLGVIELKAPQAWTELRAD